MLAAANRYHQRGGLQPYLVLFSRLGSYPQHWLDESLRTTWRANRNTGRMKPAVLPLQRFSPLVRHRMLNPDNMGWKYHRAWMEEHAGSIAELVAHIGQNGPVSLGGFYPPAQRRQRLVGVETA